VGLLKLALTPSGRIGPIDLDLSASLNPDSHPATFSLDSTFEPGTGLTKADVGLAITRSSLDVAATAQFRGGPPATFNGISLEAGTAVGAIAVSTSASFGPLGFQSSTTTFTLNF